MVALLKDALLYFLSFRIVFLGTGLQTLELLSGTRE